MNQLRPALLAWSDRYDHLREVTREDVAAVLAGLRGSRRANVLVALRSLFAFCKKHKTIFRSSVLATLATELYFDQEVHRGWEYANQALTAARRLGRPDELGIAVSAYLLSATVSGHVRQITGVIDEMLQGHRADLTPGCKRSCWPTCSPTALPPGPKGQPRC